ncbi:MAG: DUF3488 and transglutaminase-like domain-containing protein [Pseudomonadota bacterium]
MTALLGSRPLQPFQLRTITLITVALLAAHSWVEFTLVGLAALLTVAWRLIRDGLGRPAAGRWELWLFGLLGVAMLALDGFGSGFSRTAVHALSVFAGLKVLEMRSVRDLYAMVFVDCFLLATLFLVSQSIGMATALIAALVLLMALLVSANSTRKTADWRSLTGTAAALFIQALPLAVLFFVLFPRLGGPLWGLGLNKGAGITGLSDSMAPGNISQLVQSEEIAFRAEFDGLPPGPQDRYWRGPVLWQTDGRRWSRLERKSRADRDPGVLPGGEIVEYRIIQEPNGQRWILALDTAFIQPSGATLTEDFELLARRKIDARRTFALRSTLAAINARLEPWQREAGLQLGGGITPRMRALVARFQEDAADGQAVVNRALAHFRNQPFAYSLSPPLLGKNTVDAFLFDTRTGFCEHYAGAFVTLMRLAGLPARVVTGYQGGEINPINGQLLVRQSDAHAWTEVWIDEEGWVRVDPTAAVAPERIDYGLDVRGAISAGGLALFQVGQGSGWQQFLRQARWAWDAVEMAWYRDIVNYTAARQQRLLERLGLAHLGYLTRSLLAVAGLTAILAITALLVLFRRRVHPDALKRLYDRYCRKLARRGLARHAWEGPMAYSARVNADLPPPQAALSLNISALFARLRYGRTAGNGDMKRLRRLVRAFRP